ncbi:protein bimA [Fusarium austroafricanum]|uniref:Protein bimA n=1 Tax=Fusarium austroafricanum TaxID=2364996 RepID=A0A8H4JWL7_9HYPO|nr:protein bimA [Fusarium austroafricanum]
MSSRNRGMEEAGLRLVYRQLDNDLNENALFLLDRLQAIKPDDASLTHLRSLCCLRLGRFALASEYSRGLGIRGEHLGCSYIFAQSCLHRENYPEGISALEQAQRLCGGSDIIGKAALLVTILSLITRLIGQASSSERFIPDLPSVNRLLGKLHHANGDLQSAARCFVSALELDPFMWDAFTDLCESGIPLHVSNVFKFKSNTREDANSWTQDRDSDTNTTILENLSQQSARAAGSKVAPSVGPPLPTKRKQPSGLDFAAPETEGLGANASRKESVGSRVPVMPQRRSARLNQDIASTLTDRSNVEPNIKANTLKRQEKQRAIIHPASQRSLAVERRPNTTRSSSASAGRDGKPKNERTANQAAETGHSLDPRSNVILYKDHNKLEPLLQLFSKLGTAYYHLQQFKPQLCFDTLASLPADQQATPWVLSKTARSQYEMQAYRDARSTFRALRRIAPSWTEDLEVYSTVLWHLHDEVMLAFHAHELADSFYLSSQTWCAMGSSFSLQKAHADAIKCFKRATQLQPQLAHSYSLLGHEHLDAEHWSRPGTGKARKARGRPEELHDGRKDQPNKWGLIDSYREGKDPNSSSTCLVYLERAAKLELPKKLLALTKLQSAKLRLRLGLPVEALRDLHSAEQIASDEAEVHFLLGKAYLMSGKTNRSNALKSFTTAQSLNPRNEAIKEAMLSLEDDADYGKHDLPLS